MAQALLNLSYTNIVAPTAGIVTAKSVEVGQQVQPGQMLLTISQTDDIWITANFKETQLRRMRPGQSADIAVDAFKASSSRDTWRVWEVPLGPRPACCHLRTLPEIM